MKITILEPLAVEDEKLREMGRDLLDKGYELNIYNSIAKDEEEAIKRIGDSEILVIANSPLSGDVIRASKNLKMIAVAFTGVDHVDLDACREKNISVSNAAGYSNNSVAELVFGMIISLYRNILDLDTITREGGSKTGYRQRDIKGKTLGVVGTGAIGREVINLGKAFGCKLVAYNRSKKQDLIDMGVDYMDLESLLKVSDIISLHLPLTESTKGIIGKEELGLMKEEAIIINAARGPIINMDDLYSALEEGIIGGAGIDVFDTEPPLKKDYPILSAKNTLVTPHIGFATEEAMVRRADITFNNIRAYLKGQAENLVI